MKYYFYPLKERYSGDNCTKYKIKHLGGEAEARSSVDTNLPSSVMPGYLPWFAFCGGNNNDNNSNNNEDDDDV